MQEPTPNVAQPGPRKVVLNCIISFLEFHEAHIQWLLGESRPVNEVVQGKKMVSSGFAGSENSLFQAVKAMLLSPKHEVGMVDDGVQPAQGVTTAMGL